MTTSSPEQMFNEIKDKDRRKHLVYGVAFNDVGSRGYCRSAYLAWTRMLERCYSKRFLETHPTYTGCSVCDEWLIFSNFQKWYNERFVQSCGLSLDKDILVKGNKLYSPQTCCLVPQRINSLIVKSDASRGAYPIGVIEDPWTKKGYTAMLTFRKERIHLGHFDNIEDAFQAYKRVKEAYIAFEANVAFSRGYIDKRTLDALLNYKVEITD